MNVRQRRKLFAGAGLISMLMGALMVLAPAGALADDHAGGPPGNNGTVKIDGIGELDGPGHGPGANEPGQSPDNDPHIGCGPEVEFFGFDQGQTADVVFTAHAPTRPAPPASDTLVTDLELQIGGGDPAAGAGLDPDLEKTYDLSAALAGIEPLAQHGWHVKLAVTIYDAEGNEVNPGGKKFKVFWVEGCRPAPNPTYSVNVVKVNDANGDQSFGEPEQAPTVGASVPFQVTITNDGSDPVTIATLTDTWTGLAQPINVLAEDDLDCSVSNFGDGSVLQPGDVVVCTFAIPDYAPAAGASKVNTVTVTTDEGASDFDSSSVTGPDVIIPPPPTGCVVNCGEMPPPPPPPPPLPDVITDACPNIVGIQRLSTSCATVLPDQTERPPVVTPPVVTPPVVTPPADTPPAVVPDKPERTEVKGDVVTRQLPRTGSESQDFAALGAGLLLLGAGLVLTSRSRFARAD